MHRRLPGYISDEFDIATHQGKYLIHRKIVTWDLVYDLWWVLHFLVAKLFTLEQTRSTAIVVNNELVY